MTPRNANSERRSHDQHRQSVIRADAAMLTSCAAAPSTCGYPVATNTGVPGRRCLTWSANIWVTTAQTLPSLPPVRPR